MPSVGPVKRKDLSDIRGRVDLKGLTQVANISSWSKVISLFECRTLIKQT